MIKSPLYPKSVSTTIVIANMIGTGIFTAIGFQVMDGAIPDVFSIMLIWIVGGIASLCGAFAYSEIASTVNRSGGEYAFLTKLYHPILGFLSGWTSIFVGFSAAIASLALATGEYILPLLGLTKEQTFSLGGIEMLMSRVVAIAMILSISFVHLKGVRLGGKFQNYLTGIKLIMIGLILLLPFVISHDQLSHVSYLPTPSTTKTIFSSAFAGSLVWVMFSYSGWNASSYIIGSMENPKKTLPFSLIFGTLVVTVIYVLLNGVFLYVATFQELNGQIDIGNVVVGKVLGSTGLIIFSGIFSFALTSGINAMFIAAPRVADEIGKDYPLFKRLSKKNSAGAPSSAILFISMISCSMVLLASFQQIVEYIGLTLTIFSVLTVASLFVIRYKKIENPLGVKCIGYPVTPIIYIALSLWMIGYFVIDDPKKILWAFLTFIPGILLYYLSKKESGPI